MPIGHYEFHPTEAQYGWLIKRDLVSFGGGAGFAQRYFGPPLDFFFNSIIWLIVASVGLLILATSCH